MNFDPIAPIYDLLVAISIGKAHRRSHQFIIEQLPVQSTILVIGGGSGQLLLDIIVHARPQKILYLEKSSRMLKLTEQRLKVIGDTEVQYPFVVLRHGDESTLNKEEKFDVIISPFVLDMYTQEELVLIISALDKHLLDRGHWILVDFYQPLTKNTLLSLFHEFMYRFFRTVSGISAKKIPDYDSAFSVLNYVTIHSKKFDFSIYGKLMQRNPAEKYH